MKRKLLLVEDEPDLRELLSQLLRSPTLEITAAANGKEGLAALRDQAFDGVLSDIRMPIMDGLQMLFEMRATGIETPIILLTAYGDMKSAIRALQLGATDFLEKPINPAELDDKIKRLVDYGYHQRCLDEHLRESGGNAVPDPKIFEDVKKARLAILTNKRRGES